MDLSFKLDPFDESLFVFCNRSRDCLKILEWDGDGFWIHIKRLEKGKFTWAREGRPGAMELSPEELDNLLGHTKQITYTRRKREGKREEDLSKLPVKNSTFAAERNVAGLLQARSNA